MVRSTMFMLGLLNVFLFVVVSFTVIHKYICFLCVTFISCQRRFDVEFKIIENKKIMVVLGWTRTINLSINSRTR